MLLAGSSTCMWTWNRFMVVSFRLWVVGWELLGRRSALAGGGGLVGPAGGALAAVLGQVGQQVVHGGKRGAVDQVAALALLAHQARVGQLLEVERQRVGRNAQLLGQPAGREPLLARHHQGAEHPQAHFLGQGGEGSDDIGFLHGSIIQQKLKYRNIAWRSFWSRQENSRKNGSLRAMVLP